MNWVTLKKKFLKFNSVICWLDVTVTCIKLDKKVNIAACHFERSEKTLESATCRFKGFHASLPLTDRLSGLEPLSRCVTVFKKGNINFFRNDRICFGF